LGYQTPQAFDVFANVHIAADGDHRVDAVIFFQAADLWAVDEAPIQQKHLDHAGTDRLDELIEQRPERRRFGLVDPQHAHTDDHEPFTRLVAVQQ
jgi:hypothetical protein